MICHPITTLAEATYEHMRRLTGRRFRTRDVAGRRVELTLLSVTDMRPRRRLSAPPEPLGVVRDGVLVALGDLDRDDSPAPRPTRPFGLLFVGPSKPSLGEGLYDLELPWLLLPELRLTPLGEAGREHPDGHLYEAVVD